MKRAVSFAAGFAAGWIVRSTVDSSREAVVKIVSLGYEAAARGRRIFALERERLDDLAAEARARVDATSDRAWERRPAHDGAGFREHEQR